MKFWYISCVYFYVMYFCIQYGDETVIEGDDRWLDVNVVSSLLKSFFRKLPEPVITHGVCPCLVGRWFFLSIIVFVVVEFLSHQLIWCRNCHFFLLLTDLYEPIINANRIENPERRMLMVKKLLHELPETYFETFRYIAKHLNTITNNDTNKVTLSVDWGGGGL